MGHSNVITVAMLASASDEEVALVLGTNYVLEIPLSSIGITNDPVDIASDHAWALYCGELLVPASERITAEIVDTSRHVSVHFEFVPQDIDSCQAVLRTIGLLFSEEDSQDILDARTPANDFETELLDYPRVHFPELADAFLANYVHGIEAHLDEQQVRELYRSFPTWEYGFWRSFFSQAAGTDLYASTHSWVIPRQFDLQRLLSWLGWAGEGERIVFGPAAPLKVSFRPWLLVGGCAAVWLPMNCINSAAECWCHALWSHDQSKRRGSDSFSRAVQGLKSDLDWWDASTHRDYLAEQPDAEWFLTDDGSIAGVSFDDVTVLTFLPAAHRPSAASLEDTKREAERLCQVMFDLCGLPSPSPCDWPLLDDESFEELCYDVLRACSRFDPERIRKLGKSRSRDGGRDLEAWTRTRTGEPARKWIFQCKFSARASQSLSGSQISVSDVVDQYNADGYGVMTNRTIDATLYDKLDQIAANHTEHGHHLHVTSWSVYELERFLYPRKDILRRYFGSA